MMRYHKENLPMPEKLTLQNYNQLTAIDGNYFWFQGRLLWVQSLIKRFLLPSGSSAYADLGCGTGQLAKSISETFGFEITFLVDGHDFDTPLSTKHEGYQFINLDLESAFNLNRQFDLITCLDVLEHLEKDHQFLFNTRKHLKSNGLLVLTVPAFSALFSNWDTLWGHYRRYSKKELEDRLQSNGFEVVFASYFWSFLFPMAVLRKLRKTEETEFPQIKVGINRFLIWASRIELAISRIFRLPLGTSLIVVARPLE